MFKRHDNLRHWLFLVVLNFLMVSSFAHAWEKITAADAESAIEKGTALLFDVRELDELKEEGMAAPATFFPKSSIDAKDENYKKKLSSLPKDKTLIFYCRSGKRAGAVADEFALLGFKTKNMGGFQAWKAAGFPVSKP